MNILVLGGTGAMGSYLVDLLVSDGYQVTVTSRSRSDETTNVRYLKGDAQDPRFLDPILSSQQWSVIVDFMVYTTHVFKARVNGLLTATSQYVFLSSSRVYAQSNTPLTEESPRLLDVSLDQAYLSTDEYALSKARQEDILFDCSQSNWTVIRPYITFSNERLQLGVLEKEDWLFRALNDRTIVFCKDIYDRLTTLTYGEDVARGIVSIIGEPAALGEAFHITSPLSVRWSDVLDTYLNTLQKHRAPPPKIVLADLSSFMKVHPAKYQIIYDRLYDRTFDCKKINRFIDTNQFKDPQATLKSCLEEFLVKPRFKPIDAQKEALKDQYTRENTPLSHFPRLKQKLRYFFTKLLDH